MCQLEHLQISAAKHLASKMWLPWVLGYFPDCVLNYQTVSDTPDVLKHFNLCPSNVESLVTVWGCTFGSSQRSSVKVWRSSGLTPLSKQGHLERIAKELVQIVFKYVRGDTSSHGGMKDGEKQRRCLCAKAEFP